MKALSITQPWAWIILHLGKRIENRSRNLGNYRGTLALHASKGMTRDDYEGALNWVWHRLGRDVAEKVPGRESPLLVRGAIVGVCEVVGQVTPLGEGQRVEPCTGAPWAIWQAGQPWYVGQHAYVLDQVRELTAPIPCKGALGLWTPPAEVVAKVFIHGGQR